MNSNQEDTGFDSGDEAEPRSGVRHIHSIEILKHSVGQEVAVSDWFKIGQQRIQQFAEATEDRQWIHLDQERSRSESPFGTTIAHGFLTLSLLPMFVERSIHLAGGRMNVNYGLNRVRFPAPVAADSHVRARIVLLAVEEGEDAAQIVWQITVEREAGGKPACVAELIWRHYR